MEAVSLNFPPATTAAANQSIAGWTRQIPWLGIALLLALAARFPFFPPTPYPLNDGGMFAQIVDNLRANHFLLPRTTTYNFENIPLCYPPLGFYLGAIWTALFHETSLNALRWIPLIFNLLCVGVLYFLALEFFQAAWLACSAACIYAVIPRGSEWLIMGGGLTRSPGEFFAMTAMLLFLRALKRQQRLGAIWAGVAVGLSLLTHLEAGLFAALSLTVLALLFTPVRKGLPLLMIAGVVSAIVFAPWLLWSIARSGVSPFVSAFFTHGAAGSSSALLTTSELMPWLFLVVTMALLRQPPWAAWMLATFLVVPRSAETHVIMLYALFTAWVLWRVVAWLSTPGVLPLSNSFSARWLGTAVAALCIVFSLAFSVRFLHRHHQTGNRLDDLDLDTRTTLAPGDVAAMEWAGSHTPENAKFFVFDERSSSWEADMVAEWFPYLAQRKSVYTVQGREWLPKNDFAKTVKLMVPTKQGCSSYAISNLLDNATFQYMLVSGPLGDDNEACANAVRTAAGMTKVVYHAENVDIFTRPSSH